MSLRDDLNNLENALHAYAGSLSLDGSELEALDRLRAALKAELVKWEGYQGLLEVQQDLSAILRYDAIRFKEFRAQLSAIQEALKESERVRAMLVEALSYWRPESLPPMFEGFDPVIAGHRQKWADATAALAAAQALDKKEG